MPVRLSIFNFRTFLFKSVLLVLVLVVLYILLIAVMKPSITFTQNQYQANFIFAQDFVYEERKLPRVIVGSSMATRMKFTKDDGVYNLAFGGGGPLSGLEIIRHSGYVPEEIYIESNVFAMPADSKMLKNLFTPLLFQLRGKVIAFQEKYQLLNLVGEMLFRLAGRSQTERMHQKVDQILLDKLVSNALVHPKKFDVDVSTLELWEKDIDYFQDKGTKLVFFEMPNDSRLIQTKERRALRSLINKKFKIISYVEENNTDDKYETGDGVHLTMKSASEFTNFFREHILQ